jgi:hypothetical protein
MDTTLRRNGGILHAPVGDDELVMLSIDAGRYYSVNAVARRLWELLDEPRTAAELSAAICAEFEVDADTCRTDVERFVSEMMDNGLVHAERA